MSSVPPIEAIVSGVHPISAPSPVAVQNIHNVIATKNNEALEHITTSIWTDSNGHVVQINSDTLTVYDRFAHNPVVWVVVDVLDKEQKELVDFVQSADGPVSFEFTVEN